MGRNVQTATFNGKNNGEDERGPRTGVICAIVYTRCFVKPGSKFEGISILYLTRRQGKQFSQTFVRSCVQVRIFTWFCVQVTIFYIVLCPTDNFYIVSCPSDNLLYRLVPKRQFLYRHLFF